MEECLATLWDERDGEDHYHQDDSEWSCLVLQPVRKTSSENHRRWKGGDKTFAGNMIAGESTDKL